MNQATINNTGFVCPVRNCPKKHNRRFNSIFGLAQHLESCHNGWLEKKLNLKIKERKIKRQ